MPIWLLNGSGLCYFPEEIGHLRRYKKEG